MKKTERNKEIIKLHTGTEDKKGLTYDVLADKYKVSKARIGQICSPKEITYYYCEKHNKKFIDKCPLCDIDEKYDSELDSLFRLIEEINLLKIPNRKDVLVRKRKILVTKLIDEHRFSVPEVSKLMEMDASSITHLYNSFKQK